MATFDEMKGKTVYDSNHEKIGTLDDFYVDDATNQPSWITVKTGLFGNKVNFVPLARAHQTDDGLVVAFTKEQVKEAPHIESGEQISEDDESELYSYYSSALNADLDEAHQQAQQYAGHDQGHEDGRKNAAPDQERQHATVAQPAAQDQTALRPGMPPQTTRPNQSATTRPVETGRVRLQKFIITENVTFTIPIQREEVRLVREDVGDNGVQARNRDTTAGAAPDETPPPGDQVAREGGQQARRG